MNIKSIPRHVAAVCLALFVATGANAALVGISPNANLSIAPYSLTLGGGAATYTFADDGATGSGFGSSVPSVMTGGTASVFANSDFFGGNIAEFFTDEGRRPTFPGQLGQFKAFPEFERINSETPTYIGLAFDLDDGTHYGFALLTGRTLFDFAYNDVAGADAGAVPGPFTPIPSIAPVPLPATAPLLAFAAAGFAALRRRRRAA